jgi:DASH complex subunit SPC19
VSNLEERLQIVQSRRKPAPSAAAAKEPATATAAANETDGDDDDALGPSYIADIPMRELSVLQRRKVMMLRQKRAKLERESKEFGLEG